MFENIIVQRFFHKLRLLLILLAFIVGSKSSINISLVILIIFIADTIAISLINGEVTNTVKEFISGILGYLKYIKSLSVTSLVLVNLIPLIGVLLWEWNPLNIIIIYWAETGIIGFYNVFKIKMAQKLDDVSKNSAPITIEFYSDSNHRKSSSLFNDSNKKSETVIQSQYYPQFFIALLLIIMAVHGFIIYYLFNFSNFSSIFSNTHVFSSSISIKDLIFPILLLFISHGISFIFNFIGQKEYLAVSPREQMNIINERFIIMQLVVFVGMLAIGLISNYTLLIVVMVLIKIKLDLDAHIARHPKLITCN